MDAELYQAYSIWRRAIRQCVGYAASGAITRNNKLVEASGVLGSFETDNEAELAGFRWCRGWVENHGQYVFCVRPQNAIRTQLSRHQRRKCPFRTSRPSALCLVACAADAGLALHDKYPLPSFPNSRSGLSWHSNDVVTNVANRH